MPPAPLHAHLNRILQGPDLLGQLALSFRATFSLSFLPSWIWALCSAFSSCRYQALPSCSAPSSSASLPVSHLSLWACCRVWLGWTEPQGLPGEDRPLFQEPLVQKGCAGCWGSPVGFGAHADALTHRGTHGDRDLQVWLLVVLTDDHFTA